MLDHNAPAAYHGVSFFVRGQMGHYILNQRLSAYVINQRVAVVGGSVVRNTWHFTDFNSGSRVQLLCFFQTGNAVGFLESGRVRLPVQNSFGSFPEQAAGHLKGALFIVKADAGQAFFLRAAVTCHKGQAVGFNILAAGRREAVRGNIDNAVCPPLQYAVKIIGVFHIVSGLKSGQQKAVSLCAQFLADSLEDAAEPGVGNGFLKSYGDTMGAVAAQGTGVLIGDIIQISCCFNYFSAGFV
ncbi:hypothetical protein IMSAGC013_00047 [Lachnospiraceae bacterium]|nr:hypothetical protein IMSAGC013_00047 [Lachnospiraceae bacterium]